MEIQAAGSTLPELLEEVSRRLLTSMVDPDTVGETLREKVTCEAVEEASLVKAWATLLLDLARHEHILTKRSAVRILQERPWRLQAELLGELIDTQRHEIRWLGPIQKAQIAQKGGKVEATLYL